MVIVTFEFVDVNLWHGRKIKDTLTFLQDELKWPFAPNTRLSKALSRIYEETLLYDISITCVRVYLANTSLNEKSESYIPV